MRLPPVTRSLRFRLSGMTTAVMFGGALITISVLYAVLLTYVRGITEQVKVVTDAGVDASGRIVYRVGQVEWRTLESLFIEEVLNRVTVTVFIALIIVFALSLVVGWYVAGRALRPVDRLTSVAREIEATDLSRRIGNNGPPDDELARMAHTFDSMLDRLDGAFRGQKETLASTSHDLRTPLAVIRSNLEVAMSDEAASADEWRETGGIVLRAAERMSVMVDDLLAAARLEVNAPTFVSVDLDDVVRQTAEEMEVRAGEEGCTISIRPSGAVVFGDRASLSRAVGNLVDNALRVSRGDVVIASGAIDEWGFVAVSDSGPGVDPRLVRGEMRRSGGLGLGIVRDVARLHGGRVDATSREGGGSVVSLWVPMSEAAASSSPPMSALPAI